MRLSLVAVAVGLVVASGQACFREASNGSVLRTGVASVCHSPPLVVAARSDGEYSLNFRVLDSAGLVSTLRYVLAPRPEKIVMVNVDSSRKSSLPWIARAIEAYGGSAYAPDKACLQPSALATFH